MQLGARLVERKATVLRVLRCLSVSVGTTILSAAILVALVLGAGMAAGTANLIAVACGIPPSYLGNRRWVWQRRGRGDVAREVVPFWAMSIAGLILSTWLVGHVGRAHRGLARDRTRDRAPGRQHRRCSACCGCCSSCCSIA